MGVPATLETGRMNIVKPEDVYWYNAGEYDHVADIAVAIFRNTISGSLNTPTIGFVEPMPGERIHIIGYPKATSRVDYDVNENREDPIVAPDGTPAKHVFVWEPLSIAGYCKTVPTPLNLGTVELDPGNTVDIDGMSGSPAFVIRNKRPAIAGMVVRGGTRHAHLICATQLVTYLARNVAKDRAVVDFIFRLIESSMVQHVVVDSASLGGQIVQALGEFLAIHLGDANLVKQTMEEWLRGSGPIGQLVLRRTSGEHLRRTLGTEAYNMICDAQDAATRVQHSV
jgi:hypothetical protein